MSAVRRLCVFCGSNVGRSTGYRRLAEQLGRALAGRRVGLVYGGGRVGLMGALADAALAAGGEVIGIIPQALMDREIGHRGLTELRDVGSMHERKASMAELADGFVPELGRPTLNYQRGWTTGLTLIDALVQRRDRDRDRGHTSVGPHRGDWRISFVAAPEREHLSRGQEKLSALVCLLAQAELFYRQTAEWPVICLDDLASELDAGHQTRVLEWLDGIEAQVLITGTATLPVPTQRRRFHTMFHVEQGMVTTLL